MTDISVERLKKKRERQRDWLKIHRYLGVVSIKMAIEDTQCVYSSVFENVGRRSLPLNEF